MNITSELNLYLFEIKNYYFLKMTGTLMRTVLLYSKTDFKKIWIVKDIDYLNDK